MYCSNKNVLELGAIGLSISYSYLIKFHKFRDFADNSQEGMKHQMRGATQTQQGMSLPITLACVTQHPPVHHPKHPVLGFHGWDENVPRSQFIWSVVVFFLWAFLFFPSDFFCGAHCFFSQAPFGIFFSPATLDTILYYFFGNSYLPLQPSYRPSSYQPIYLHHFAHPSFMLAFPSMYCMCIE